MHYQNLGSNLIEQFPHLQPAYQQLKDRYGPDEEPGAHVVYGDVLNPHIIELLRRSDSDQELRRIFEFLEALATSSDERVQEVVVVTVCERLNGDRATRVAARRFMGSATRRMAEAVEKAWG